MKSIILKNHRRTRNRNVMSNVAVKMGSVKAKLKINTLIPGFSYVNDKGELVRL